MAFQSGGCFKCLVMHTREIKPVVAGISSPRHEKEVHSQITLNRINIKTNGYESA
jgi:hypothetical protein